jgi:transcriptional regulator of acetoin/glycerol metabolism
MCEERAKIRCVQCELAQWADQAKCRRCGKALPAPIVNVVERVVEKVVIQQDSQCLENLQGASKLISATAAKLQESRAFQELPVRSLPISGIEPFPTLDAMERAMIVAAYRKSNRNSVEAARLLGIGKTTFYRKLKEMRQVAA